MEPHLANGYPREPRDCRSWDPALLGQLVWLLQKAGAAGRHPRAVARTQVYLSGRVELRTQEFQRAVSYFQLIQKSGEDSQGCDRLIGVSVGAVCQEPPSRYQGGDGDLGLCAEHVKGHGMARLVQNCTQDRGGELNRWAVAAEFHGDGGHCWVCGVLGLELPGWSAREEEAACSICVVC